MFLGFFWVWGFVLFFFWNSLTILIHNVVLALGCLRGHAVARRSLHVPPCLVCSLVGSHLHLALLLLFPPVPAPPPNQPDEALMHSPAGASFMKPFLLPLPETLFLLVRWLSG